MAYPDAMVANGVITDLITGDELPSYCGLVLAQCAGRSCILFTTLCSDGRRFKLVHWGVDIE